MPDPATNGAAAPETTSTIAARALESLEGAQASTPAPAEPATTEPAKTPPPAGDTPPDPSEAERLLREQGYATERKPDGREHWIPRSKVLKMIETGLKKRAAALDKEREGWTTERAGYVKQADEIKQWRALMAGDPKALLTRMAELDPRYKPFLDEHRVAQALPKAEDDPEPQPDIDLGNGRATYSLQGINKLRAWDRRQMERAFDERLKPFHEIREADQRRAETARYDAFIQERSSAQIARARTWPRFAEHEEAIVKALQEDSQHAEATGQPMKYGSIHDAYMDLVMPHLTGDHNKVRETVMKELNAAPKSTSVGTTGPEPTKAPGQRTTEEIARRAMARLEGRS